MIRIILTVAVALLLLPTTSTALNAQSRFTPAIQVGDQIVTRYQLDQRTLFLSLLNAPGDPRQLAREQLISEAIQLSATRQANIAPSDDQILSAQSEFAARADLTVDEFVGALAESGVNAQTFRDFMAAGVAWRSLVRQRFGETAAAISTDQIERALARTGTEGGVRILVTEILLPATSPETTRASRARASEIRSVTTEAEFSGFARQYSVANSRFNGGELGWAPLTALPPEVSAEISRINPGQISRPIDLENAIGLYFLRDIEQVAAGTPSTLAVDYALFVTGGDQASATALMGSIDTCDDLYGVAQGLPPQRLTRENTPIQGLPDDVRAAITGLDVGEATTSLRRNDQITILMLCSRSPAQESTVDMEIVQNRMANSRMGVMAADYLANLRASTHIVDLTAQ